MDIQKYSASNKLALSILWGIYALLLIILGIWKKKKHLRIGAIALFAVTLIKLFFYDISLNGNHFQNHSLCITGRAAPDHFVSLQQIQAFDFRRK